MQEKQNYTKIFDNCLAVFQGGGCKAIAYIGAYEEAKKRGVIFNELAGASAGAIIASLIAAGATPEKLKEIVATIPFNSLFVDTVQHTLWERMVLCYIKKKFKKVTDSIDVDSVSYKTLKEKYGIHSIEPLRKIVADQLKLLMGKDEDICFKDIAPNLHIVACDIHEKNIKVWNKNNTPDDKVADAVCASCSIPLYFQPYQGRYVDGGLLSNLPDFVFSEHPTYSLRLCFAPSPSKIRPIENAVDYLLSLADTVVDGAVTLQHINEKDGRYIIYIDPAGLNATDFNDVDDAKRNILINNGIKSAKEFFDHEKEYSPILASKRNSLKSIYQAYALVATYSQNRIDEVFISTPNNKWCWTLFPTLLKWVENHAKVTVFTNILKDEEGRARKRLLQTFNCYIEEKKKPLPATVIFLHTEDNGWCGIIYQENGDIFEGLFYDHTVDNHAIEAAMIKFGIDKNKQTDTIYKGIQKADENALFEQLKTNPTYRNATMQFEICNNIEDLYFLSSMIRLEKYRQIDKMFNLYDQNDIDLFDPAQIVFQDNRTSVISPIVIEEHNGKYYVVEGKTRLVYAHYHNRFPLKILVVRGVEEQLPFPKLENAYRFKDIIVTDNKQPTNEEYAHNFRHIEETLHPSTTYLT